MATATDTTTLEERDHKAATGIAGGPAAVIVLSLLPGPPSLAGRTGTVGPVTNRLAGSPGHQGRNKDHTWWRARATAGAGPSTIRSSPCSNGTGAAKPM